MRCIQSKISIAVVLALAIAPAALAAEGDGDDPKNPRDGVFTLGRLEVKGERIGKSQADSAVSLDEIRLINADTLDQAVKLVPGVMATLDTNSRRNEHNIFVRGFDRWEVPLSIDGVRIYLPADNRIDFSRFLTADVAEIQIQKGYASVIDGPGALGGAINLVTRKPTKPFEAELQTGVDLGRNADYNAWNGYAMVGTRQDKFYAQASISYLDRDQWDLSDDFRPTGIQAGGDRDRSFNRDSRVNVKFGFTPNDTDEYTLNYTKQDGKKGAPLNVYNDPPNPPNSYWDWPWWDIDNLYFLSNTSFGERGYVKTRVFYNKFDNALYAYDDATYTTQSLNGRFQSIYADTGAGGSVEAGFGLSENNDLRLSLNYRIDKHTEYNINRPTNPTMSSTEPMQHTREETLSLAAEDTWHAGDDVDLVVGASYDSNRIGLAQEYNATQGLFEYPTGGSHAFNGQGSVRWRYAEDASLSASVSSRTRFPTVFERFSTRFGTAVPNPDLGPERGTNYELSWDRAFSEDTKLTASLFYSDVSDMIQTVVVQASPQLTQSQNVGDGKYYGAEFGADTRLGEHFTLGGNYTWLHRQIDDALQPGLRPVGTPKHQAFLYATWTPVERFSLTPNLEYANDRWSDVTSGGYVETGRYLLLNLQAQIRLRDDIEVDVGGRNLLDENYELAWGLPEPGRTLYAKFRISF